MAPQPIPLDYYVVLGVSPKASTEEVTARYQSLSRGPGASQHIHEAYEVLADATKRSAYDSLLPGIQWKLKSLSVLGLFGRTAATPVADGEKKKADDGEPVDLSATPQAQTREDAVQATAKTKESVVEATPVASSSPLGLAEMQEPENRLADVAAIEYKNEEAPDAITIMAQEKIEADGERMRKSATAAHKEWEWHQQREEARKLARLYSEKLIKDEPSMEIFERIQNLEAARVINVTDLVAKKHAIEDLIVDLCSIHAEPLVPRPLAPRPPHLRLSPEETEKEQQTDLRLQYAQRLLVERTKEVRVHNFKNEFQNLLDDFTVLNYKILSEQIVAGLVKDILKEAERHRRTEKGFQDWFIELTNSESARLKEVLRVAPEKDQLMKDGIVEILTKEAKEGKFNKKKR